jgi:thioesterase domain-containing protein
MRRSTAEALESLVEQKGPCETSDVLTEAGEELLHSTDVQLNPNPAASSCSLNRKHRLGYASLAPIFFVPGAAGREKLLHVRFCAQSSPTLKFEIIRIGNWREWIENDLDFDGLVVRACRKIQAAGAEAPLRLAGSSQGGQLAYAAALSLSRTGRAVGFVGLLDTSSDVSLGQAPPLGSILSHAFRYAGKYIKAVVRGGIGKGQTRKRVFWTLWRLRRGPGQRRKLLIFIARWGRLLFRSSGGVILDWEIQMALFAELWSAWIRKNGPARSLHSPVFLFRSDDPGSPDLGWEALCSDLTVVPVGGGHLTMFDEEHVGRLVTRFASAVTWRR